MRKMTSRFLEDPAHVRKYDVRVAMMLGEKGATLVQQVHYHSVWKESVHGTREWRSTLKEWKDTFPYWSEMTLRRVLKDCRDKGVLRVRKTVSSKGTAYWYSLDYDVLDRLGEEGEQRYTATVARRAHVEEDEATPSCSKRTPPPVQIEQNPLIKKNRTPDQNEHLLVDLSTTPESTTPTTPRGARLGSSAEAVAEKRSAIRSRHRASVRARFEKNHSGQSVESYWEMLSTEYFGKKGYSAFSAADRKNAKTQMVQWAEKADIHLLDFLEWCIKHWTVLRDERMPWANLSERPSFRSVYSLRDRFLEQYSKNGGGAEEEETARTVYTTVNQIPKNHPQYTQLKILVERLGRAEA